MKYEQLTFLTSTNKRRVLFVGGGRRYELAGMFSASGYDVSFLETSKNVPVADIGDVYVQTRSLAETIIGFDENYFDLIIPFQDKLSFELASMKHLLNGKALVCDLNTAEMCYDKSIFEKKITEVYPEIYPSRIWGRSIVAKPKRGFGSNGIQKIYSKRGTYSDDDIQFIGMAISDYVFQRLVQGKEYSVDCFFSPEGKLIDSITRVRERVSGGEVFSSRICRVVEIDLALNELINRLDYKFEGPVNFQFIIDSQDDKPYLIEANARFGGGFTFSINAGLDVFKMLDIYYFGSKDIYLSKHKNLILERSYRDHYFEAE